MLYFILKLVLKAGLWVFFRRFEVRNRALMPEQGPLLVVSNHPNTFMDPIVIASLLRQQVYFIAKSTAFNSPFNKWLLHRMNLIPIHRREDAPEQSISNEQAFEASNAALEAGKTLLIFPEGNSFNERRLRKLKTGTARIALGAEANANYSLNVRILPVGLNYSDPTRFRSDVFVNVGKPIVVADFAASYNQDPVAAAQALTDVVRQQLEKLIIVTPSDEEDELIRHVETIYKSNLVSTVKVTAPSHEQEFLLTKSIAKSIGYFKQTAPERVAAIKEHITEYMLELKKLHLQDALLGKGSSDLVRGSIRSTLFLLLGFPLYFYGLLNNYLPYIIPSKVANLLTEEEEFEAPIMLSVGIFTFPVFYAIQGVLFWQWFPDVSYLLLYLVSLPLSGFFTLRYWNNLQHTQGQWLLLRLFFKRKNKVEQLQQQRKLIIEELEKAKNDYLLHVN